MPSRRAGMPSTSSRPTYPSGRKRSTRAARSGSARAPEAPVDPTEEPLSMEPAVKSDDDVPVQRSGWRNSLRRLTAPIVFLGSLALKLGSLAKFAALFVAFGGYTLIWG